MTHDADELDRLRLALLHERSRADRAERELAELRAAEQARPAGDVAEPRPGLVRRLRRRR
jgi:hypothetical protein